MLTAGTASITKAAEAAAAWIRFFILMQTYKPYDLRRGFRCILKNA